MSNLPPAPPPPPPGYEQSPAFGPPQTHGKATAAMVCGIVGILLCGVILGPIAIVLGTQAKNEIRASGGRLTGEGMATAGIVCGIIAIVLFVTTIIVWAAA
jgi:Domain of unknown function (DUF4190)